MPKVAFFHNDAVVVLGSEDEVRDPISGEMVADLLRDSRTGEPLTGVELTAEVHSGPIATPPDNSSPLEEVTMSEQTPGIFFAEFDSENWDDETVIYFRVTMTAPKQEWYSGNLTLKYRTG